MNGGKGPWPGYTMIERLWIFNRYPLIVMALDIFSTFDDHNKVLNNIGTILWVLPLMFLFHYKYLKPASRQIAFSISARTSDALVKTSSAIKIGGRFIVFKRLFEILSVLNGFGLFPYCFRATSHLAINLSVALPFYISVVAIAIFYSLPRFLAHLRPLGTPSALNPFLCVIELVRNLVRPITLAVRLTANLSTGHILIGLIGRSFTSSSLYLVLLFAGRFYFAFEYAVCRIQAYIFTLLPTLYADEHPNLSGKLQ